MPAKILRVHVREGDQVAAGAPLVTLNAMKMELICDAPADGTVEAIACQPGDLVAADDVLVHLKVSESSA
jgi:biotin carboxyl carrier protein